MKKVKSKQKVMSVFQQCYAGYIICIVHVLTIDSPSNQQWSLEKVQEFILQVTFMQHGLTKRHEQFVSKHEIEVFLHIFKVIYAHSPKHYIYSILTVMKDVYTII